MRGRREKNLGALWIVSRLPRVAFEFEVTRTKKGVSYGRKSGNLTHLSIAIPTQRFHDRLIAIWEIAGLTAGF